MIAIVTSKSENARGTLLDARGTTHAFRVLHRHALVCKVHDVDTLMADTGADITRDALRFLRENAEPREPRVNVHQRRQRAGEAAPDSAGEVEVEPDADDAGQD